MPIEASFWSCGHGSIVLLVQSFPSIHRSAWKKNSPKFMGAFHKYNPSYRCTALGTANSSTAAKDPNQLY
jgi:hypothetical protein